MIVEGTNRMLQVGPSLHFESNRCRCCIVTGAVLIQVDLG